jgi:hypothetical protein
MLHLPLLAVAPGGESTWPVRVTEWPVDAPKAVVSMHIRFCPLHPKPMKGNDAACLSGLRRLRARRAHDHDKAVRLGPPFVDSVSDTLRSAGRDRRRVARVVDLTRLLWSFVLTQRHDTGVGKKYGRGISVE